MPELNRLVILRFSWCPSSKATTKIHVRCQGPVKAKMLDEVMDYSKDRSERDPSKQLHPTTELFWRTGQVNREERQAEREDRGQLTEALMKMTCMGVAAPNNGSNVPAPALFPLRLVPLAARVELQLHFPSREQF